MFDFIVKAIVGLGVVSGMTLLWAVVFPVALMGIILYMLKLVPMTGRHRSGDIGSRHTGHEPPSSPPQ